MKNIYSLLNHRTPRKAKTKNFADTKKCIIQEFMSKHEKLRQSKTFYFEGSKTNRRLSESLLTNKNESTLIENKPKAGILCKT